MPRRAAAPLLLALIALVCGGCQRISLSTETLGLVAADAEAASPGAFGPFASAQGEVWSSSTGKELSVVTTVDSDRATVLTTAPDSKGSPRTQSVLRFVRLGDGSTALSSVERPRDNLELRFSPPLVVIDAALEPGVERVATSTATATRSSGKDAGSGEATATMVLEPVVDALTGDGATALTLELSVDFGFANWARTSVHTVRPGDSRPSAAKAQEQLRVLSMLIRDETLTLLDPDADPPATY